MHLVVGENDGLLSASLAEDKEKFYNHCGESESSDSEKTHLLDGMSLPGEHRDRACLQNARQIPDRVEDLCEKAESRKRAIAPPVA